ncbi:MAG: hypothetical protein ACW98A_06000 [Candidatus Hodarchaeales archaeon]
MNFLKKKYLILIFPLLIFSMIGVNQQNIAISAAVTQNLIGDNSNPIVMLHEGKNQFFNSTTMKGSVEILNENNYTVITSSETINRTSLTGIDILIIPGSPNPSSSSDVNQYSDTEIFYIKEWLEQPNHGLVLLSNPYTSNSSLNMNSNSLNRIISQSNLFLDSRFTKGSNNLGVSLQNLYPDNYEDPSILTIEVTSNTQFPFNEEKKIVSMSNSVNPVFPVAEAGMSVFGLSADNSITLQGENPVILGGSTDDHTSSRLFLIGSALMFSDLPGPDSTNTSSISWLNTADNAEIWLEIIKWTLDAEVVVEKSDTFLPMITLISTQIILGIVLIFVGFLVSTRYSIAVETPISTNISKEGIDKITQSPSEEKSEKNNKTSSKRTSSRRKQKRKK